MHPLAIIHCAVSLLILVAGLFAWRLTSSRSVAFLSIFGSAALLFSAHFVQTSQEVQLTYFIPFIVFSLLAGRAIGFGYRSLNESLLRKPSLLLGGASVLAMAAAVASFIRA